MKLINKILKNINSNIILKIKNIVNKKFMNVEIKKLIIIKNKENNIEKITNKY